MSKNLCLQLFLLSILVLFSTEGLFLSFCLLLLFNTCLTVSCLLSIVLTSYFLVYSLPLQLTVKLRTYFYLSRLFILLLIVLQSALVSKSFAITRHSLAEVRSRQFHLHDFF